MTIGLFLLSRMSPHDRPGRTRCTCWCSAWASACVMQVLVIIVQNAVPHSELGVATSGATFFRSIGGSFGTAIFGAIFSNVLVGNLASHLHGVSLPPGFSSADVTPAILDHLPAVVHAGFVAGYAESIQTVFLIAVPIAAARVPRHLADPAGGAQGSGRPPRPPPRRRRRRRNEPQDTIPATDDTSTVDLTGVARPAGRLAGRLAELTPLSPPAAPDREQPASVRDNALDDPERKRPSPLTRRSPRWRRARHDGESSAPAASPASSPPTCCSTGIPLRRSDRAPRRAPTGSRRTSTCPRRTRATRRWSPTPRSTSSTSRRRTRGTTRTRRSRSTRASTCWSRSRSR